MIRVKICGITRPPDAEAAIRAGADLLGFIFVPGTPRYLDPERAGWVSGLQGAATVGVFRNATLDTVLETRDALGLDWVQLHGDEPDSWLARLGERVIRRVAVPSPAEIPGPADGTTAPGARDATGHDATGHETPWKRIVALQGACLPLLDPGAGDGTAWDWERLGPGPPGVRFGLAGGLDPDTVGRAIELVRPFLVDVSSGVESGPGLKDHGRIRAFIDAARRAAAAGTGS